MELRIRQLSDVALASENLCSQAAALRPLRKLDRKGCIKWMYGHKPWISR